MTTLCDIPDEIFIEYIVPGFLFKDVKNVHSLQLFNLKNSQMIDMIDIFMKKDTILLNFSKKYNINIYDTLKNSSIDIETFDKLLTYFGNERLDQDTIRFNKRKFRLNRFYLDYLNVIEIETFDELLSKYDEAFSRITIKDIKKCDTIPFKFNMNNLNVEKVNNTISIMKLLKIYSTELSLLGDVQDYLSDNLMRYMYKVIIIQNKTLPHLFEDYTYERKNFEYIRDKNWEYLHIEFTEFTYDNKKEGSFTLTSLDNDRELLYLKIPSVTLTLW